MKYCFNREQTKKLLELKCDNKQFTDSFLNETVMGSANWEFEIHTLSYINSMVLEGLKKEKKEITEYLDRLYNFDEEMNFLIDEVGNEFIKYILLHVRDRSINLEDDLVNLKSRQIQYDYSKSVHN